MTKILVLIRHGHRELNALDRDNQLSAEGVRQAHLIGDFFIRRFGRPPRSPVLRVSPKQRCRQTIAPLEALLQVSAAIDLDLDESGSQPVTLSKRVASVLKQIQADSGSLTVLCSHGDWIPVAVEQLAGIHLDPAKGSWTEFSLNLDGSSELRWCVPDLGVMVGDGIAVDDISG